MSASNKDNCAQNINVKTKEHAKRDKIRKLNDQFRKSLIGGQILLTSGIIELTDNRPQKIINIVCQYDRFNDNIDPYGEHDMGAFEYQKLRIFWKIDYYDKLMNAGSPDPSDPEYTTRVLTIMLASEY